MATRSGNSADEFGGTNGDDSGPILGGSNPIDPTSLDGSGGSSGDGSAEQFDARIHVGTDKRNADGSYTRKRGRKAGGGTTANTSKAKASPNLKDAIDGLSKTLIVVHAGLASVMNAPEMQIDQSEAALLATATANLLEQFDLKPDPKIQAVVGLVMACGTVYGPRVFMMRYRKAQEAKEKRDNSAGIYDANGHAQGTTAFAVVN